MRPQPSRTFIGVFVLITILTIIGDWYHWRWLHYTTKPLIMLLLLGWSWQHREMAGQVGFWLRIGMVFALIGDICLMIWEVDLFAPGLGAFLLMQLCYIRAFYGSIRQAGQTLQPTYALLTAVPLLVYAAIFLIILEPNLTTDPAFRGLWWPIVGYVVCLVSMGWMAAQRQGLPNCNEVLIGALLFILSDSSVGIEAFLRTFGAAPLLILGTYATAQYLIIIYTYKAYLKQHQAKTPTIEPANR